MSSCLPEEDGTDVLNYISEALLEVPSTIIVRASVL